MQKLDALKNKRKIIERIIDEMYEMDVEKNIQFYDKVREMFGKLFDIDEQIFDIEHQMFLNVPPVKNNDMIDLRQISNCEFSIYLHNQNIKIGEIQYRGYHCSRYFGDVGYCIFDEYRGNNYAYEALCLLSEKLNEDGINSFWISTHSDNIPSIKTIEKYDGELIEADEDTLLFECKTKMKTMKKKPTLKD